MNITRQHLIKKALLSFAMLVLILVLCPAVVAEASEQTVEVGIPVEEHPELFLTRSMPTHGEGKIAVFLIQFPDYMNDNPEATREYYDKLYFSGGINDPWWGETTVAEFYYEQSYGKLNLSGQVFDWYTAKHERSYYDDRKAELIMEAAAYYQAQGVDFSEFDGDGDGTIDAIAFHFAGESTEERYTPWYPGVCYNNAQSFGEIDGFKFTTIVQVDNPIGQNDNKFIGTICHELMHTLGMPDLYGEIGSGIVNTIDLMSQNDQTINPYLKMMLGWIDTVRVITETSENVRLDICEMYGDVVIVTDKFNNLFDEFYMVAYREYYHFNVTYTTPAIWHVDARLNEDASGFRYHNLSYDPDPNVDTEHDIINKSAHLFIEELSADPKANFVHSFILTPTGIEFTENSILGPNHLPSTDTHDGEYTGIQIDNFKEHRKEYLTFDVAFVKDIDSPVITTEPDDIGFTQTVRLYFNEYVYAGKNWDNIRVTDIDGNPVTVDIALSYYPHHEIQITFQNDIPKKGYTIIFPDEAVQDSSGNGLKTKTLTVSKEKYLFPVGEVQELPNPGEEYIRDNSHAYFFPQEDGIVVITSLWEPLPQGNDNIFDRKLEFLRLTSDGTVVAQTIIENPFANYDTSKFYYTQGITETANGDYIIWSTDSRLIDEITVNVFFCVDRNGNIKWINDIYEYTDIHFFHEEAIIFNDGILISSITPDPVHPGYSIEKWVFIDHETGRVYEPASNIDYCEVLRGGVHYLGNGLILIEGRETVDNTFCISRRIVTADTFELVAENYVEYHSSLVIQSTCLNDDGTILIFCGYSDSGYNIQLLNAELNVIKTLKVNKTDNCQVSWFKNDGFCLYITQKTGDHSNNLLNLIRYDRTMTLMWKMNVEANYLYCFKDTDNNVHMYRSMWGRGADRKSYIDYCGSEENYRTEHIHALAYAAEIPATCTRYGVAAHWYCSGCGRFYSDEKQEHLIPYNELIIPALGHSEKLVPGKPATCVAQGTTDGTKCEVCNQWLVGRTFIQATGQHLYGEWSVTKAPTCVKAGVETRRCLNCDNEETRNVVATGEHLYDEWTVTKEPTCIKEGTEERDCYTCSKKEYRKIPATRTHVYGEWTVTEAATCAETGVETRKCNTCDKTETREIPATGNHVYGEWAVTEAATCAKAGVETCKCNTCDKTETREVPATGNHVYGEWTVTEAATCAEAGVETRKCNTCDKTETREIPATGNHVYGEWAVTEAATCAKAGVETRKCNTCDKTETREIPATGNHVYGEWAITREATTEEEGEETRACTDCDAKETRMIPVLPKDYTPIIVIGIGAVVVLGGVSALLFRKKRK